MIEQNIAKLCPIAKSLQNQHISIDLGSPHIKVVYDKPCPLVLIPKTKPAPNFIYLQQYFFHNHKNIILAASQYGAVMFKGFDIQSAQQWASILYNSGLKQMQAIGGAGVRKLIVGSQDRIQNIQVVTANQAPSSAPIWFHHQQAQLPNPPSHVAFCCLVNATHGGATPLIRSDYIYDYLQTNFPDFTQKIEQSGVIYERVVPYFDDATSAQGRSWRSMFQASNMQEAEAQMTKREFNWEWDKINQSYEYNCTQDLYDLRLITKPLSAVRVGSNGKKVFFNQVIAAYKGWKDPDNVYARPLKFGDGSELPNDILQKLDDFIQQEQVIFPWQPGQFCIVDNMTACHARQPFQGKRLVLAALIRGTKQVVPPQNFFVLSSGDIVPDAMAQIKNQKKWVHINLGEQAKTQQTVDKGIYLTASIGFNAKTDEINMICKEFLESIGRSSFDICFLECKDNQILLNWKEMSILKQNGLALNIGLLNARQELLGSVLEADYQKPYANLINDYDIFIKDFKNILTKQRKRGILTIISSSIAQKVSLNSAIKGIAKLRKTSPLIAFLKWTQNQGVSSIINQNLQFNNEQQLDFKLSAEENVKFGQLIFQI